MMHEFRVLYRWKSRGPEGPPIWSILVEAGTEEEAKTAVEADPELMVVTVCRGRPLIDWNQPTYSRDEAAVVFKCTTSKISQMETSGELPMSRTGKTIFTFPMFESALKQRMVSFPRLRNVSVMP
jgi:hypothetical protein